MPITNSARVLATPMLTSMGRLTTVGEAIDGGNFQSATTAQLNSVTAAVNTTNKFVGKTVWDSTAGYFVTVQGTTPGVAAANVVWKGPDFATGAIQTRTPV